MPSDNESLELAEQWVVEQIDGELHDEQVVEGLTIDAGDLDSCDCVPVDVTDSRGRRWQLVSARRTGVFFRPPGELTATYRHIGCDKPHTRADHEADRADMAHSDGEVN